MENKALLTHEQALDLIEKAQSGEESAKEELIVRNTALVKSIVKKFLNRGTEFEDLMQIGLMGLYKAVKNYNPDFNVRFSTYAVPMIAGEIKRFLRDDGIIKVSRSVKEIAGNIFRVKEHLKKELKREPKIDEIAREVNMEPEEIVEAIEALRAPISLYEPAYEDENSKTMLIDKIIDDTQEEMIDKIVLKELITKLEPRERKLIFLRFFKDKTQMEIAEILGVSQVQVSRLLTKTLSKLKKTANS